MSARLQPLSGLDALFLHIETPEMPMHVGSLETFELPARDAGAFYEDVKRHIGARLHLVPAFTRKLATMPFAIANPVWIDDPGLDLDYHVRHMVLSKPGSMAQLHAHVGRLHSSLLDRSRPLWEIYVIEGLASGERAMYTKIHHAAVDGAAGAALTAALLDTEPAGREVKPVRRPRLAQPTSLELLGAASSNTVMQLRKFGSLVPQLARLGGRAALAALRTRASPPDGASARLDVKQEGGNRVPALSLAPRTPLNCAITNRRSFAATTLDLAQVKSAAKALGATINDLVMAICASALRAWLTKRRALPRQPLVAAVPFSLRASGNTQHNNQVSMMLASLGTDHADPLARLAAIRASMERGKRITGGLRSLIPTDFPSFGTPWLLSGLAALYARSGLADHMRPVANLVISNVMGPQVPLYLAGARMTHYWPVSIPVHGAALNITAQSYDGRVEFGLIACRRLMPQPGEFARLIEAAAEEYIALGAAQAAAAAPANTGRAQPARRSVRAAAKRHQKHDQTTRRRRAAPRRPHA